MAEVGGELTLAHVHFAANPSHVDLIGDVHDTTVAFALHESEGLLGAGDHALPGSLLVGRGQFFPR